VIQYPTQSISKNISDEKLLQGLCSQRAEVVNYPLIQLVLKMTSELKLFGNAPILSGFDTVKLKTCSEQLV